DLSKIAEIMRSDWDRRIAHDYRFWMSDGHSDDEAMWSSGQRDFDILCEGLTDTRQKTLLDLGCGVGRLVRAGISRFGKVVGFDVSEKAITKAREFFAAEPSAELHVGSGYDLKPLTDGSIDVALSFAAITSMPTDVAANYFRELWRVLKPGGVVRLQMYIGK